MPTLNKANLVFYGAGGIMAIALVLAIFLPFLQIATPKPAFTYRPDMGNGHIEGVCAGDTDFQVRIVGYSDGTPYASDGGPSSISIVVPKVTLEDGTVMTGQARIALSSGVEPRPFDFFFPARFDAPLPAGEHRYEHAFFNVYIERGASAVRGFASTFTVEECK